MFFVKIEINKVDIIVMDVASVFNLCTDWTDSELRMMPYIKTFLSSLKLSFLILLKQTAAETVTLRKRI